MRVRLAIVIVSYNTRELLARCLDSIFRHPAPFSFQVIVVDNDSKDGSPEMARERFPQVLVRANAENRGYGPAFNEGQRAVDSDQVLLLNSDTEILPGMLEGLAHALETRPRAGVIAPLSVDGEKKIIQMSWGWKPLFWGEILQKLMSPQVLQTSAWRRALARWLQRRERMAPIVSGAAMIFPREALNQVGGMDEDFVFYLEDSDMCARLWKAGWQVIFYPQEKIIHHLGKSSTSRPDRIALLFRQSQLLFYRKHGSRLDRALIQIYLRLKFWRIYFPPREPGPREFYRQLRGVLDGRVKVAL